MTIDDLIREWWGKPGGQEKSNLSSFIPDLCEVLGLERPKQAEKGKLGAYEYEASVPGGSFRSTKGTGGIDLYKRGHFILEAKQSYLKPQPTGLDLGQADLPSRAPSGAPYDTLMRDAWLQARNYARNLPSAEPVSPFLIVCDVGRAFELYVDPAGNGRDYEFFPDRQSYRIELTDLASPAEVARTGKTALELLHAIWTNPTSVDPRFQAAEVTRKVAANLAEVSKYLEEGIKAKRLPKPQHDLEVEEASLFLMRVLFCMFAEDIDLLPARSFEEFLKRAEGNDGLFANGLRDLFEKMNNADPGNRFSLALETDVRYFNGGLFEDSRTYQLGGFLVHNLYEAARQNWRRVEPAIFGTLLEQALSSEDRSKLGAHYTPRPYVETLVRATIMDVLEPEWEAIEQLPPDQILAAAELFHDRLAALRVLDPACGTGNFLYVSLELLQALESKVVERIQTLGGDAGPRIGPHQFHGLELNPRAAKIAELVLWIGWLRNRLKDDPEAVPEPVLQRGASINFGQHGGYDAVLRILPTGDPDLASPLIPDWPEADFIVGNPPFIGGKDIRRQLGGDYAEALWQANPRVPKSADFVMQWWDRAAHQLTAPGSPLVRFGFVTTNSITQTFSRRVIEGYLNRISPAGGGGGEADGGGPEGKRAIARSRSRGFSEEAPLHHPADGPPPPLGEDQACLSLILAIPDHPWTKASKDAAAVRIAMTVAARGQHDGTLIEIVSEHGLTTDNPVLGERTSTGRINPDLSLGSDVTAVVPLMANSGLSVRGVELHADGYVIGKVTYELWLKENPDFYARYVKRYIASSDLIRGMKVRFVADFYDLSEKALRQAAPSYYQHLLETALPERRNNAVKSRRELWWRLALPHSELRDMLSSVPRFIATVVTSKHRWFTFADSELMPDQSIMAFGSDNGFHLGVLSSNVHCEWTLQSGGTLEDRPRYNKSRCFDPFPFPDSTPAQRATIAGLAEELDATRKAALAEVPGLTMTAIYNWREKLRASAKGGAALSPQDQDQTRAARAGIVERLHQQIDAAVAEAYGWPDDLAPAEIVTRLVALNAQRAAEEQAGTVRWLRPEYQIPRFGAKPG